MMTFKTKFHHIAYVIARKVTPGQKPVWVGDLVALQRTMGGEEPLHETLPGIIVHPGYPCVVHIVYPVGTNHGFLPVSRHDLPDFEGYLSL